MSIIELSDRSFEELRQALAMQNLIPGIGKGDIKLGPVRVTKKKQEATMGTQELQTVINACAQAAHEANRAYCEAIGDHSQVPWERAPLNIQESAVDGVRGVLEKGHTAEESHKNWLRFKVTDGWVYGPEKDAEKKTHPCMVPYAELPEAQRWKDELFVSTVLAMALALGFAPTKR